MQITSTILYINLIMCVRITSKMVRMIVTEISLVHIREQEKKKITFQFRKILFQRLKEIQH